MALYRKHKNGANRRGIDFLFTFEEWFKIWMDSGHWHERGRKKGQYVMARFGDKGPYAIGNVKIILHEENASEGTTGRKLSDERLAALVKIHRGRVKTESERAKLSKALLGRKFSMERRANISKGSERITIDYLGNRMTISQALYASGNAISQRLVQERLRKGWPDREAVEMPKRSKSTNWPSLFLG